MNSQLILIATLSLLLSPALCIAETIKLKTDDGKVMVADYLPAADDAEPVLLLHGFLQTREFSTVNRLATSLHESGYSVLNPTLSLGLNNRNQSLSCEAIHTHSLDDDSRELQQWITWLKQKIGKPITLIGHSAGGPVMLKYVQDNNAQHINHLILISLSYYASGPVASETRELADKARKAIRNNSDPLDSYALSYCKTYPTYASAFLSYYDWNRQKVSSVVKQYNKLTSIIMGTADRRVDNDWRELLESQHSHVIPIQGANHFFDQAFEFDLLDTIENLLQEKTGS